MKEYDKIEREEAFCDDWHMVRKMGKTPQFADAIEWADTHPNWIKVEDRLPENSGQECLVITKMGMLLLTRWNDKVRVFECTDRELGYYKDALTYWMPIVLPKID